MSYYEDVIELIEHKGAVIKIMRDNDPRNPREDFENFGTLVTAMNRNGFGDENVSDPEEWLRSLLQEHVPYSLDNHEWAQLLTLFNRFYIVLPVYAYIHSGITISTGAFSCPWDSGQAGHIFVSKKDACANWSKKRISQKVQHRTGKRVTVEEYAKELLRCEVETLDDCLRGNVVGYVVEIDGENVESCWGFYPERQHPGTGVTLRGWDEWGYVKQEEMQMADYAVEQHLLANQCGEH